MRTPSNLAEGRNRKLKEFIFHAATPQGAGFCDSAKNSGGISMERYATTQNNLVVSVNRWKNEGALIAISGLLLLVGVFLAGGDDVLSMLLFGTLMLLGAYIYANDRVIRNISYRAPVYQQYGEMQLQPMQWQPLQDWDVRPQWDSYQQQWQNQNVQRRMIN